MNNLKKHLPLKILLSLLPTVIFYQNYAWMTGNQLLGLAFILIWALMIFNVQEFTEKDRILERLFRLTEVGAFLLPISAIILMFVFGSDAVSNSSNEFEQAGAIIGTAIGGTLVVILAFIFGLFLGIIMHLIANKYSKTLRKDHKHEGAFSKHGVALSVFLIFFLVIFFGAIGSFSNKKSRLEDNLNDANSFFSTDPTGLNSKELKDAEGQEKKNGGFFNDDYLKTSDKKKEVNKVDLELINKGFVNEDFQDKFTFDFKLTNNTDREIRGFQGKLSFFDIFDNEITSTPLSYDKGVSVGEEKIWNATAPYNQFIDEQLKLKDTPLENLRVEWKLNKVVYSDEIHEKSFDSLKEQKVGMEIMEKGFETVNYQDYVTFKLNLNNNTENSIKGVQGLVILYDIFDEELYKITLTYDKQVIEPGSVIEWIASIDYNMFLDEDVTLKNTELGNMTYEWKIDTIVYGDGTKETF